MTKRSRTRRFVLARQPDAPHRALTDGIRLFDKRTALGKADLLLRLLDQGRSRARRVKAVGG